MNHEKLYSAYTARPKRKLALCVVLWFAWCATAVPFWKWVYAYAQGHEAVATIAVIFWAWAAVWIVAVTHDVLARLFPDKEARPRCAATAIAPNTVDGHLSLLRCSREALAPLTNGEAADLCDGLSMDEQEDEPDHYQAGSISVTPGDLVRARNVDQRIARLLNDR